ncbi:MAG: hypothetical protein EXR71_06275 [Myxococcales bacterium]|nr:hypothetical protein [Myxococcales bacterium]
MLLLPLLLACGADAPVVAPPVAGPVRTHHVVEAREDDLGGEPEVIGGNRPPIIRAVRITPGSADRTQSVTVTVDATDPEGKRVEVDYEWSVDGREQSGKRDATLVLADYARGSTVQVAVRVSDAGGQVATANSEPLTIANANPRFAAKPSDIKRLDGFLLEASDPDGDTLSFRVEGAPPGVTLDSRGYFHYTGSEAAKGGTFRMKVLIEDGHGGEGRMEVPLDISAGSKGAAE